jgi:UDP-GlcNAc:undecaprenyl-phosphate GlcNAc-1-phosphate transferase
VSPYYAAIAGFGISFVASIALIYPAKFAAGKLGLVSKPRKDRWASVPVPMLGGVAIFLSFMAAKIAIGINIEKNGIFLLAATGMFALGLIDDFVHINPPSKLIGQIICAMLVIYFGTRLNLTGSPSLNLMITLLWIVGITNAFNLLDNMDGLAVGIALIAVIFMLFQSAMTDQVQMKLLAVFAGALLGFGQPVCRLFRCRAGA